MSSSFTLYNSLGNPVVYNPENIIITTEAHTFTTPQRTSITTEDNIIDFTVNNNFTLNATTTLMGTPTLTSCTGQSGVIIITSAENITGWDAYYKFKIVPTDLEGEEVLAYFIESETSIRIGRVG